MTDPFGRRPAPGPDQPPIPVRLVTVAPPGDGPGADPAELAKLLAGLDADVICLPETDSPLQISQALGMQLTSGAGNALLSRLPLLVSDVQELPGARPPGAQPPVAQPLGAQPLGAMRTLLELDGAALWVTTAHLGTGRAEQRAAQVAAICALQTGPMETGVLVGDFPADAATAELAVLRERFSPAAPAGSPGGPVEQVWFSDGVAVTAARVLDGTGTDRAPLVVDLAVRSGV